MINKTGPISTLKKCNVNYKFNTVSDNFNYLYYVLYLFFLL